MDKEVIIFSELFMRFKIIFVIALALLAVIGVYLASHWVIWISTVRFFGVMQISTKFYLASGLLFLAGSYFLTSVLTHFFNNPLTRVLYWLSAVWMGLVANLVLAFAIVWLIRILIPILQNTASSTILGAAAVFGAIAVSSWGIWNAQHPIVKRITIPIVNLPAQWKGKTIVQLSDIHLGYVYRENFLQNLIKQVNALEPDLIVITGDLFDGHDGDLEWVGGGLAKIAAPQGVYYVTGNHETYLGVDEVKNILAKTRIVDLRDSFVNLDGLQLVGVDYPLRAENKDIAEIVTAMKLDPSQPSVLLYHAPVQIKQIKRSGISLQLSGHTHAGQQFPFRLVSRIIYRGYDYGLHRQGDYSIYTSSGVGTWGPPMRTDNKPEIVEITLQ